MTTLPAILLVVLFGTASAVPHMVQLWDCTGSASQTWTSGSLCLRESEKCLHAFDKAGSALFAYKGHTSRRLGHDGRTSVKTADGQHCLHLHGDADITAEFTVEDCDEKSAQQKFHYNDVDGSVRPHSASNLCLQLTSSPCDSAPFNTYDYCNVSLDIITRAKDLVKRLTVAEKITQLDTQAAAISRLNIPAYQWWSEALHGVAGSPGVHFGNPVPCATSFPQVINLGATFNMELVHTMAMVISTEARAFANVGHAGLSFFAPNINIFRDPRWGRGQETPGEDPYLTSLYARNFVRGMQFGYDRRYLKVAATCKHYAAYDLERWNGTDRFHFNAVVSDQDLYETYFPAFAECSRYAASIMCSYNAVNGVPSCGNNWLMNEMARREWGFQGYFVSDCGAVGVIQNAHHYTNTTQDTVAVAMKGGCDLDCGKFYGQNTQGALDNKTITEEDLNLAVFRLFGWRILLGMFDPSNTQPFEDITPDAVNTKEHQYLALEAARESMVLLQNNNGVLPLKASPTLKVALIGPNAAATGTMQGNYHGTAPFLISPQQGIQNKSASVQYVQGCDVKCTSTSGFNDAKTAAAAADVVILVVGLDQGQESEGHDRTDLTLPGNQLQLMQEVKTSAKGHVIAVIMAGGPVDISWAKANVDAILWVGYPGQAGGMAIADVLFGDYNPGGALPYTIYPADYVNQISMFDMGMRSKPGRSYKFYTGEAVFAFGDGLSYTTFEEKWSANAELSEMMTTSQLSAGVNYRVTVTNTGKLLGDRVVQAYIMRSSDPDAPIKELFGFRRVKLAAGASEEIFFDTPELTFSAVDKKGQRHIHPGKYTIAIGQLRHHMTVTGPSRQVRAPKKQHSSKFHKM